MLTARWFFLSSALLLFASVAFSEGDYQRTKDGKTFVWNSDPKPGDEAAWSGARDGEGYASGFGTLTWYTGQKQAVRHLGIPFTKANVYARYFGNMVRGKFNGPVNIHSQGKTGHAVFADGKRTSRWAAGPAPSRPVAEERVAEIPQRPTTRALPVEPGAEQPVAKTEKSAPHIQPVAPKAGPSAAPRTDNAAAKAESAKQSEPEQRVAETEKPVPPTEPASPASGPSAAPRTDNAVAKAESAEPPTDASAARTEDTAVEKRPEVREQKSDQTPVASATSSVGENVTDQATDAAKRDADNSLRLLAGPPSALHIKSVNNSPPANANPDAASSYTNARLTKEEVVDLADAEAHSRGYDLTEYRRLDPQYNPADEIWSLGYDQRPVDGTEEVAKHFNVIVDDKTKGTVLVTEK